MTRTVSDLADRLESGSSGDDAVLAEHARQLRLLLLDCAGIQPN